MRNKVNTEIKAAKKVFYNNKFIENNGDPRKTWQTINDLTSRKAAQSSIREINLMGSTFCQEYLVFLHFKNANTIHYKKSLYSIVVKTKCSQNVKCSRFECPYCKATE